MIILKYLTLFVLVYMVLYSLYQNVHYINGLKGHQSFSSTSTWLIHDIETSQTTYHIIDRSWVLLLCGILIECILPICFYMTGNILITDVYVAYVIFDIGMTIKHYVEHSKPYRVHLIDGVMNNGHNSKLFKKYLLYFIGSGLSIDAFFAIPLIYFLIKSGM